MSRFFELALFTEVFVTLFVSMDPGVLLAAIAVQMVTTAVTAFAQAA